MTTKELENLLDQMSLQEKIGQLVQTTGAVFHKEAMVTGTQKNTAVNDKIRYMTGSVLGMSDPDSIVELQKEVIENHPHHIPLLFMGDVIYGFRTIFSIPLAQACSFNEKLVQECLRIVTKETARAGIHITFAPMADLARDARWGRVMESFGEDPYLSSCMVRASVKAYQGETLIDQDSIGSCIKHFAGYGAAESGKDYNAAEISRQTLLEDYMQGYLAGIEAGAKLVMSSFNSVERIPATANQWLLKDVLREKFHFQGSVISDWGSIYELIDHGVAEDKKEAAKKAFCAGTDIDMVSGCYENHLAELVHTGLVDESEINKSVLRILHLKNELGLFENPFAKVDMKYAKRLTIEDESREKAEEMAAESMVLLKNHQMLPLSDHKDQTIAFIGPFVDEKEINGSWAVYSNTEESVTVREAAKNKVLHTNCVFAKGCSLLDQGQSYAKLEGRVTNDLSDDQLRAMKEEALSLAKKADTVVLLLGEPAGFSGEAASRMNIELPKIQKDLLSAIYEVNPSIVLVVMNGRPLVLTEEEKKTQAILEAWIPGTFGNNALIDVLFGKKSPSGRLCVSFPYHVGQVPIYYSTMNTGRPLRGADYRDNRYACKYLDGPSEPLYPFGYGLSYTTFEYGEIQLSTSTLNKDTKIIASIDVTNSGTREGKETVQLYLHDKTASIERPIKQLKAFYKIHLMPGETKTVSFTISEEMLRFYNKDMEYESEPGKFELMIGPNSQSLKQTSFELVQ